MFTTEEITAAHRIAPFMGRTVISPGTTADVDMIRLKGVGLDELVATAHWPWEFAHEGLGDDRSIWLQMPCNVTELARDMHAVLPEKYTLDADGNLVAPYCNCDK